MKIADAPGATPLDEDTLQGLLPNLTTQGELNEFEAKNISDALIWASKSRALKKDLLSVSGLVLLHKKCLIKLGNGREPSGKETPILVSILNGFRVI